MESKCWCQDPQAAGVALMRWCFGLLLLLFGIAKLPHTHAFAQEQIVAKFQGTWLPTWLLDCFGHAIPILEVVLGIWLILGFARNLGLFLTGLYMIALTFGQVLLMQPQVVFSNFVYTVVMGALLLLDPWDKWIIKWPKRPAEAA